MITRAWPAFSKLFRSLGKTGPPSCRGRFSDPKGGLSSGARKYPAVAVGVIQVLEWLLRHSVTTVDLPLEPLRTL